MKPDTFEDAYARIQAATKARTQTEIANLLGIKQSSISDAKKKNTIPDGWLVTLYRTCGLEPDWVLYGQKPVSKMQDNACGIGIRESVGEYAAAPSRATVYAMARTDRATGAWIRESLESIPLIESLAHKNLLVVKMDTAGMEPTIRRNAYVGLDCDDTRMRSGEIYAVDFPGEGLILKRIVRDLEAKRLVLLADNSAYQAQYLPLDTPGITPIGKAIWVIQEI